METAKSKLCTFYVGDYYFGLEISLVQEVLKRQNISQVPLAPQDVKGLLNLRGEIITAIDMWSKLNIPREDDSEMNVVIHSNNGTVSLVVEKIGDIIAVDPTALQNIPSHLSENMKALLSGVYQLTDTLLLLINLSKI